MSKGLCKICDTTQDLEVCMDCYAAQRISVRLSFKRRAYKKHGTSCHICGLSRTQLGEQKNPANPLTIHHLDPLGDRYDVDNVRPICRKCHDKVHIALFMEES